MSLRELHRRIAQVALRASRRQGFALGGGNRHPAAAAYGLRQRADHRAALQRAGPAPHHGHLVMASSGPAATGTAMLELVIASNTDLPDHAFTVQKDLLRRVAGFDPATSLWHARLIPGNNEWAVKVLSTLFEAARVHCTTIRVQARAGAEASAAEVPVSEA